MGAQERAEKIEVNARTQAAILSFTHSDSTDRTIVG